MNESLQGRKPTQIKAPSIKSQENKRAKAYVAKSSAEEFLTHHTVTILSLLTSSFPCGLLYLWDLCGPVSWYVLWALDKPKILTRKMILTLFWKIMDIAQKCTKTIRSYQDFVCLLVSINPYHLIMHIAHIFFATCVHILFWFILSLFFRENKSSKTIDGWWLLI